MQSSDTKTSERLARALGDLEALRKQNKELEEIFRDIRLEWVYIQRKLTRPIYSNNVIFFSSSFKGDQKEAIENFQSRLTKAEHSYKENQDALFISPKEEPNSQYELLRRRISSNTKEFWYFIHSGLLDLQKKTSGSPSDVTNSINHLLTLGSEQKRWVPT